MYKLKILNKVKKTALILLGVLSFLYLSQGFVFAQAINKNEIVQSSTDNASQQLFELITKMKNMKADFTQVIINNNQNFRQESKGFMWISKPSNFKWETTSPNSQLLVSNGKKLWNYDEDLEQVTVQEVPKDVSAAPYLLLLTGTSNALSKLFEVKQLSVGAFRLKPKVKDQSMLSYVDMVFVGDVLQSLTIQTEIGQKSVVVFSNQKMVAIPSSEFNFVPPEGVDVLG
jgi:outer membrane lipoprotein carrier protein